LVLKTLEKFPAAKANSLYILLSVEEQSKQCAQQMLRALSRDGVYDISFQFLRTEIAKGLWEGFRES
jgi:hypothetical protein